SLDVSPEELARRIVNAVANTSGISYKPANQISLLTAPAKILITIIREPKITIRALAIYIGISEAAVIKSLKMLLDNNLIAKTKVKGKNNYTVVKESFEKHSDIIHLLNATQIVFDMGQLMSDEEAF
ncbi:MAG: winged helix-turn-helix domain-containing protein, partial [Flavobacteriales bacterium]